MKKGIRFSLFLCIIFVSALYSQNPRDICPSLDDFLDVPLKEQYERDVRDQIGSLDLYDCVRLKEIQGLVNSVRANAVQAKLDFDFDDKTFYQSDSIVRCIDEVVLPFIYSKCPELDSNYTPPPPDSGGQSELGAKFSNIDLSKWGEVAGALREVKPEIYDTVKMIQDTLVHRGRLIMNLATSDHFTQNLADRRLIIIEGKLKEIELLWETNRRWADSLLTYENTIADLNHDILDKEIRIRELELFRVRARRSITYPNMDAFVIVHGNMAGFYYDPQFMIYGADARIKSKDFFGVPLDLYARINAENAVNRGLDKNFVFEVPLEPNWDWLIFRLKRVSPGLQYHSKSYYNPSIPAPVGVHPRQIPANDVIKFAPWTMNVESNIWQFDLNLYATQYHNDMDRIGSYTAGLRFRFPADTSEFAGRPRAREDGEYSRLWTVETFINFSDDMAEYLPYGARHNTYFGLGASNGAHNLMYAKNIQHRMLGRPDFNMLDLFPLPLDRTLLGLYVYGGTKVYNEELGVDFFLGTKPLLVRLSTYCDANSKWLSTNLSPRLTHVDVVPERFGEVELWWLRDFFPIGLEVSIPYDTSSPYEVRLSTFMNIRR